MIAPNLTGERADLLEVLTKHRGFLRHTVAGITEEQARLTPTASALSLGGLIKHVSAIEKQWFAFMTGGAPAMQAEPVDWENGFRMTPEETLPGLLDGYATVAAATDDLVATHPDLGEAHPLPQAPWFEAGASWSVRRVLMHIVAETAQHAGHADILRETIDGQKTMG